MTPIIQRVLIAATVAGSTLAWTPTGLLLPGRSGFLIGGLGTALLLLVAVVSNPRGWTSALGQHRRLVGAAGLVILSRLASVIGADAPLLALVQALRVAAVLGFLLAVVVAAERDAGVRRSLAFVAGLLLVLHAGLYIGGTFSEPLGVGVFETLPHQHTGTLPRFTGICGGPGACGLLMLCCVGLVRGLDDRGFRGVLTGTGLVLGALTLSFPTLAMGAVFCWRFIEPRVLRIAATAGAAAACLLVLHVHPLELRSPGSVVSLGTLPTEWETDGLGPTYMPVEEISLGDYSLACVRTVYHHLAVRSLGCFVEHPVVGVGGRNHPVSCPVMTLNTVGEWGAGRLAHNEYTGLLAEHGLLGLLATLLLLMAIGRGYRLAEPDRWRAAALVGVLVSGLGGEVWYQFPVAALLAVTIRREGSPPRCRPDPRAPSSAGRRRDRKGSPALSNSTCRPPRRHLAPQSDDNPYISPDAEVDQLILMDGLQEEDSPRLRLQAARTILENARAVGKSGMG